MKRKVLKILFIVFIAILFFTGIGFGLLFYYSNELPPLSELQHYDLKIGSEVFDRHDNLIHTFSFERRQLTNLNELPDYLKNGMIAVEDKNFYEHWGMDLTGFFRALLIDISKGSFSQGASTITQQLARNMSSVLPLLEPDSLVASCGRPGWLSTLLTNRTTHISGMMLCRQPTLRPGWILQG